VDSRTRLSTSNPRFTSLRCSPQAAPQSGPEMCWKILAKPGAIVLEPIQRCSVVHLTRVQSHAKPGGHREGIPAFPLVRRCSLFRSLAAFPRSESRRARECWDKKGNIGYTSAQIVYQNGPMQGIAELVTHESPSDSCSLLHRCQ